MLQKIKNYFSIPEDVTGMPRFSARQIKKRVALAYICSFMLFTTISIGYVFVYTKKQQEIHDEYIEEFFTAFSQVMNRYFSLIYSTRGVFSLAPDMTQEQWDNYAAQILHHSKYPGMLGISIAKFVEASQIDAFLQRDRKLHNRELIIRSLYTSNPISAAPGQEFGIIQYSHNFQKGAQPLLGYDVLETPRTRDLFHEAADEDKSFLLFSETPAPQKGLNVRPVVYIVTPFYKKFVRNYSVAKRRIHHIGWVITPIQMQTFVEKILEITKLSEVIALRLSMGQERKNYFIYQTDNFNSEATADPRQRTLPLGGSNLRFDVKALTHCLHIFNLWLVVPSEFWWLILGSALLSCLLSTIYWSLMTMNSRATELAYGMTEDLRQQELTHRRIIANIPGILFTTVPGETRVFATLSTQFEKITGYRTEEMILQRDYRAIELVHPEDIAKVESIVGYTLKNHQEYFLDYRLIHRNGHVVWVHERAKVVYNPDTDEMFLTGYFSDITEQKRQEGEYRDLVNALENAVDGVAFITDKGFHARVNEAYTKIVGANTRDLSYKPFYEMFQEAEKAQLHEITKKFELSRDRRSLRLLAHTYGGKNKYLSLVLVPFYQDSFRLVFRGFYAFVRDVSYDVERELDLANAVEEAEKANRTKSTFLATMSHELRTPLNAIIGYSDMLLEDAVDLEHAHFSDDLKKINNAGRHLLTLINDVLDVSKLEAGKMTLHYERFNIFDVVKSIADMVTPTAEKNHNQLVLLIDQDIGEMYCDLTKLKQMIFNLLSNACKFTKEGYITLSVTSKIQDQRELTVFSVKDTGIGITEKQKQKLFTPFVQAHTSTTRDFGGTGLGLTITKKFTELLGGTINLESTAGEGTEFIVTLPRSKVERKNGRGTSTET